MFHCQLSLWIMPDEETGIVLKIGGVVPISQAYSTTD
jgi:hypothetical protein